MGADCIADGDKCLQCFSYQSINSKSRHPNGSAMIFLSSQTDAAADGCGGVEEEPVEDGSEFRGSVATAAEVDLVWCIFSLTPPLPPPPIRRCQGDSSCCCWRSPCCRWQSNKGGSGGSLVECLLRNTCRWYQRGSGAGLLREAVVCRGNLFDTVRFDSLSPLSVSDLLSTVQTASSGIVWTGNMLLGKGGLQCNFLPNARAPPPPPHRRHPIAVVFICTPRAQM